MIKVFYFYYNKDKYYSSTPIVNNFRILFDHKNIFLENDIDLTPFIQFVPDLNPNEMMTQKSQDIINTYFDIAMTEIIKILPAISHKFTKIIFLGFHPIPFNIIQKYYTQIKNVKNCFTILWQDDLQAYFSTPSRITKLNFADFILTPSPIYLENKEPSLLNKTKFLFYHFDPHLIKNITVPFDHRKNQILLSGVTNEGYPIRNEILLLLKENHSLSEIATYLKKPRQKEFEYPPNSQPFGINYYKVLAKYKGAFFGYHQYPLNFNLAKIIEILSVGCIGFFEESPLLEKELGLIAFKHYVPCTSENKLITKVKYYQYFLSNDIGRNIALEGQKYIYENFSNEKAIPKFIDIFNSIG